MRITLLTALWACLAVSVSLAGAPAARAAAPGAYKAEISVQFLDQPVSGAGPVVGVVRFKLIPPGGKVNGAGFVKLNGPILQVIQGPGSKAAMPVEAVFDPPLSNPVRLNFQYMLPFRLKPQKQFRALLGDVRNDIRMLHPGTFKMKAIISSPPASARVGAAAGTAISTSKGVSDLADVVGSFESDWALVTVKPDDVPDLPRQLIFDAINRAQSPYKEQIIIFYAKAGVLAADDLVRLAEKADPAVRANITEFYVSQKHPLSALTFFKPLNDELMLKDHKPDPVFLVVAPRQKIRVRVSDLNDFHSFDGLQFKSGTIGLNRVIEFQAPRTPGLYTASCRAHHKVWGWFLVRPPSDK